MQNLEELLNRAKTDENAFREVYDMTVDRVFRYVVVRTKDKEEAKEIVQEIYLSFWKSLPKFNYISEEHFYGFFWKVVRRRVVNFYTRKQNNVSIEEVCDIPAEVENYEDYRHLFQTISKLPKRQRLVIELRYFAHYSFEEISTMLGISESNSKVLHHRAMKILKNQIHDYDVL